MKSKFEIHPIQTDILIYLLFHKDSRFSQINENNLDSDSFNFHLKSLLEAGLIEKKDLIYNLTIKGKEFANRFDTERSQIERQAKIGVVVIGTKQDGGITKYLMQERLKHPFFGYVGFVTGKVTWGETVFQTGMRELFEETGMKGDFHFCGIEHKLDYSENNSLLEDKFFYTFKVTNLEDPLIEKIKGGRNFWATRKEIEVIKKKFDDVLLLLDLIDEKEIFFQENKYIVKEY